MVVEEARNLSPKPTILFFYFKQGEGDRDNFVSMARSLLAQLLKQDSGILDYVYNRCCNSGEAFLTSRVLIEELLLFALGNCNSAYIVLDGLDECRSSDERKTVVEFFRNLIENLDSNPDRLRCLFVSRKDSARKDFNGLANIAVGLESNEDDIDGFSHARSQKLGTRLGVSEQRLQEMDPPPAESFTIGLIYIKPLEFLALTPMLDERFASVPIAHGDQNDYTLGRIGSHNVVIVGPARGDQGTVATAQFVTTIRLTFPNISIGLLVGIGGGIPHPASHDVRLGDVVVGAPETGPALVQYDLGKRTAEGFKVMRTLAKPPAVLRKAVNKVEDKFRCLQEGEDDILAPHLERFSKYPRLRKEYQRPSAPDRRVKPTYIHEPGTDCLDHDAQFEEPREPRESDHIVIHYGTILSGSTLMKSSQDLDELSKKHNAALCFEMEAAGLMDVFPCLVIRGICDYSDSHKSDRWQGFAARAAAAYAREVLLNMSRQTPRMPEAKAAEDDPGMGLYRAVFSGAGNKGVQVGYNVGSITNTFGRK
jgi:nucleoside phosphorylase